MDIESRGIVLSVKRKQRCWAADLGLCFRICIKACFLRRGSYVSGVLFLWSFFKF